MRTRFFLLALATALSLSAVVSSEDRQTAEDVEQQVATLIDSMEKGDMAGKAAADKLVRIGVPAVERLLIALKHPNRRVRYWSVAAVARIRDERAFAPLVVMAKTDPDGYVRATAMWYLQNFPRQEVWDLAVEKLDDESKLVRGYAIRLLKEKGHTEAIPKLRELTKHREYETRYDAMVAVTVLAGEKAIGVLRTIVRTDDHETVRKGALSCVTILKKKPPAVIPVLIDGLEDPSEEVRAFAAKLLRKGANQTFYFQPGGDAEARAAAIRAWRTWYEKHKDRLYWDDGKRRFEIRAEKKQAKP